MKTRFGESPPHETIGHCHCICVYHLHTAKHDRGDTLLLPGFADYFCSPRGASGGRRTEDSKPDFPGNERYCNGRERELPPGKLVGNTEGGLRQNLRVERTWLSQSLTRSLSESPKSRVFHHHVRASQTIRQWARARQGCSGISCLAALVASRGNP